jgi:hypothetical protein
MTNAISLTLGLLIALGLLADFSMNDGASSLFLARKLMDLLEWLAFWR